MFQRILLALSSWNTFWDTSRLFFLHDEFGQPPSSVNFALFNFRSPNECSFLECCHSCCVSAVSNDGNMLQS